MVAGSSPVRTAKNEVLGSPVTPPALGAGELAGSNPAIPTKVLHKGFFKKPNPRLVAQSVEHSPDTRKVVGA